MARLFYEKQENLRLAKDPKQELSLKVKIFIGVGLAFCAILIIYRFLTIF